MPLDYTPGGSQSNSYVSNAEAVAYMADRLNTSAWDNADPADQDKALMMATKVLDRMGWKGVATTDIQKLRWPRAGVSDQDARTIDDASIPSFLKDATAELALFLLTSDRLAERDDVGVAKVTAGPVTVEFDKRDLRKTVPDSVFEIIAFYVDGNPSAVGGNIEIGRS